MNSRRLIARSLVVLLLPALLVAGLPGSLCACLAAAKTKSCCGKMDGAPGACCCTTSEVPCGCCPRDVAKPVAGECGCVIRSAAPTVTADAPVNVPTDAVVSWVVPDAMVDLTPRAAELRVWAMSLPPPDLVIELRNLRI